MKLAFFLSVILFSGSLRATPVITTVRVSQTTVATGTPTTVTIQASITDPAFVPGSADLLKLNADGSTTVLGTLHDDGMNGDLFAGDLAFALTITVNQPVATQLQLQVSAAFAGQLLRVRSSTISVFVQPANAPQQALAALAQNLSAGNLTAALSYLDPFSPGVSSLSTTSQQSLNFWATQISTAVLAQSSRDRRLFRSQFTKSDGTIVTLEFEMVPGADGQWILDNW